MAADAKSIAKDDPMKTTRLGWAILLAAGFVACGTAQAAPAEGFVDVPGGRVWYRTMGTGRGTPLLVLHGGRSGRLVGLAALGDERPIIFYDQLGCGHSKAPNDPKLWTVERYVAEFQQRRVPGAKLVVVERAGHAAMIDAPKEYVARLRELLHDVEK